MVGNKIAVWSQPSEQRAMYTEGRWTPEEIAERLPTSIGTEVLPSLAKVEEMRRAATAGERPNA